MSNDYFVESHGKCSYEQLRIKTITYVSLMFRHVVCGCLEAYNKR